MKLYETLEKQLKTEPNFVTDNGELKKWVVIHKAQNCDAELIELLLDNQELKEKFFLDVKGTLVFNQNLFVQFMEQKNYLNDSYTAYKNKVGLTIDGKYLKQRNEVALVWPFKDCILEGGQSREEDKREEIFFNETLAQDEITQLLEPKVLTNAKTYNKEGEHPFKTFTRDADLNKKRGLPKNTITDNLLIKGNNLLALHSLKKEFAEKVKLIYIDPPYNTDEDGFKYNDSFNHSTWLTFLKNRLEIAKTLLSNKGILFAQINDIEMPYLKVLLDEIFGRECFESSICVKMSHLSGPKMAHKEKKLPKIKEYILMYSKVPNAIKLNPQYTPVSWDEAFDRYTAFIDYNGSSEDFNNWKPISLNQAIHASGINKDNLGEVLNFKMENANKIYQTAINRSKNYPKEPKNKFLKIENKFILNGRELIFASEKIKDFDGEKKPASIISDIWTDIGINNVFQEGGKEISLRFGKKPEMLLERIIALTSNEVDLIMDFFVGTGTTCAVAHKMSRQYIGIEQLDYIEDLPTERIKNVVNGDKSGISSKYNWQGGGEFVYLEIKKYNQTFIEKIEAAKDGKALLKIWEQMKEKSFLNYNVDIKKQEEHIEDFKALSLKEQKQHLCGILDKNQLYVNLSSLNDKDFTCTDEEKKVTQDFYQLKK